MTRYQVGVGILTPFPLAASVDYETDKKIQDTIADEFEDRTILCIAREFPTSNIESERRLIYVYVCRPAPNHHWLR